MSSNTTHRPTTPHTVKPSPAPERLMSTRIAPAFQDALVARLAQLGEEPNAGLPLQALLADMPEVPRRSAQRWLAQLVDAGWLNTTGRARATRYHLAKRDLDPLSGVLGSASVASRSVASRLVRPDTPALVMREPEASLTEIPLSAQAQEVLQLVSKPLAKRTKATYNPTLLEQYQPNTTEYLPAHTRERLMAQGQVYAQARAAGTYARDLANRLLIDLSWNSSRLEGNTYSLLETERLLALGTASDDKTDIDTQMILNHKVAIEFMLDNATEIGFTRYTLMNLHAMLADNLLANPAACGALRKMPVWIGQSRFSPIDAPQQIDHWFDLFLTKAQAIENPFEQALFALVHIPYLQAFEDVNKRTARLAANIGFFKHNLCPLSFVDMPQVRYVQAMLGVYELGRIDLLRDLFVWAYLRSCARYNNYLQVVSAPDPLRVKYRSLIHNTVAHIVSATHHKTSAIAYIRQCAKADVEPSDQARFIEVVETQLMSLHEGNMARYGIKPAQFEIWLKAWV